MLGKLEEVAMMSVLECGRFASAANAYKSIIEHGATYSLGAVFTTLERLEKKGFLKSKSALIETGTGTKERKVYELTGSGQRELNKSRAVSFSYGQKLGWGTT